MSETTKGLVIEERDAECYITKFELWKAAIGHLWRAIQCWPLTMRYGFRDWSQCREFLDNAWLCLKSSLKARW